MVVNTTLSQVSDYYINQASTADVAQGATNQVLLMVNLRAESAINLESVRVRLEATINANNSDNVHVYYTGATPSFNTSSLYGTQTGPLAAATNYTIAGAQTLNPGDNYFWVCLDVSATGVIGETVDVKFNGYTTSGTLVPITNFLNDPFGERTIVAGPVESDCGDGIDNDGDGLIDCFDSNCFGSIECAGNYYGTDPKCQRGTPNLGYNAFAIKWASTETENDSRITPMVGDIDADCIPEIITMVDGPDRVKIYNGITGQLERDFSATINTENTYSNFAIGDINNDGFGEIVKMEGSRIAAYSYLGVQLWTSSTALNRGSVHVAIADFDGDGNPEVYGEDQIFNGATGVQIADANGNRGDQGGNNGSSIAADVLSDSYCTDCAGLELIIGAEVYSVNIGAGTATLELDVVGSITLSNPSSGDGFTSVGDIDNNDTLDVVVAGQFGGGPSSYVYAYTPETGAMFSTGYRMNDFTNGTGYKNNGRPTLADLDGDGDLEIVMVSQNVMGVLHHDFTEIWSRDDLNDQNSGQTSSTAYDLDGNGSMEIIYRDETDLYIFEGMTGATVMSTTCYSQTRGEYPIVADVNLDGIADIVTVCGNSSGSTKGPVTVFNDDTHNWISARSVWHQHGYNPTFINDDLSVPTYAQPIGNVGMNNFHVQSPRISTGGTSLVAPRTDMIPVIDSIVPSSSCDTDSAVAYLSVCNSAGEFLDNNLIKLSVYEGDPLAGGTLIKTVDYNLDSNLVFDNINCNSTDPALLNNICMSLSFNITPGDYMLYAKVNDDGSDPANSPVTTFNECNTTNNVNNTAVACALVLPLEEINLKGQNNADHNRLIWNAFGTDLNKVTYEIYKSPNAKDFVKIGEVNDGTDKFEDHDYPLTSYYQVRGKTSKNNFVKTSNTIYLKGPEQISVYSFGNGEIRINGQQINEPVELTIVDMAGKLIKTEIFENQGGVISEQIRNSLSSGMYIVQLNGVLTGTNLIRKKILITE